MIDVIDLAEIEGLANILLAKFEARFLPQVCDVTQIAGQQIIGAKDGVSLREQSITKMRTEKAGATRYQHTHSCLRPDYAKVSTPVPRSRAR